MTLEYLEIMEEIKSEELRVKSEEFLSPEGESVARNAAARITA